MAQQNSTSEYAFKDVPLSAAIIEVLAMELFRGKVAQRQPIFDEVLRVHLLRGGQKPDFQDSGRTAGLRALQRLVKKGLVQNPDGGYWRFPAEANAQLGNESLVMHSPSESIDDEVLEPEASIIPESVADIVVGSGTAAVYLYYLPTYRLKAEEHKETAWPCKIGRSDRDPLARIFAQAGTALPETPHVALIVRTSFAPALETALHGVLTLRGRRIEDSPGTEWFITSPTEILELVNFFDPALS